MGAYKQVTTYTAASAPTLGRTLVERVKELPDELHVWSDGEEYHAMVVYYENPKSAREIKAMKTFGRMFVEEE